MRVMGIDHGNTISGFGVVDFTEIPNYVDHGLIRKTLISYPKTLLVFPEMMEKRIVQFKPDMIAFEGQKDIRGYKPTQKLFELVGCYKQLAVKHRIPYVDIPPTTMKKYIANNGWASKEEVARVLAEIFKMDFEDLAPPLYYKTGTKRGQIKGYILDGSDALGLALCSLVYKKRIGGYDYDGR